MCLLKGVGLGVIIALVGMISPLLTKMLIDKVYPTRDPDLLVVLVAGSLAISIATTAMGALRSYYTLHVSSRLSTSLGLMFFNHLQHLPVRFFEHHRVGEITSRFGDLQNSLKSVSSFLGTSVLQGLYLVVVPPLMFIMNWKLAVVALLFIPLRIAITVLSAKVLRRHYKRAAEVNSESSAYRIEVLSNIRTLKTIVVEHDVFGRAQEYANAVVRQQLIVGALVQGIGAVRGLLSGMGMALLTWFGWSLIIRQEMSLGEYMAFMAYLGYFTGPLLKITTLFGGFQQTAVSLGRAFEYLDISPEQDPTRVYRAPAKLAKRANGKIELRRIAFSYRSEKSVLRDVSLSLAPSTITALVGPSGAGKSTLLRLLCRMDEPDDGEILLDGQRIEALPLHELRSQFAVVWQDAALVKGSLWDNLVMGAGFPSQSKVDDALDQCCLKEFVTDLPDGLHTQIAEWGATISSGQRQRIALARALIRDAPVLILDEAGSNIDVETETKILQHLVEDRRGRTTIWVTHRPATAALADRICVLDGGRVVDIGRHRELLGRCKLYQRLQGSSTPDHLHHLHVLGKED